MFGNVLSQVEQNSKSSIKRMPGDYIGDGSVTLYINGEISRDGEGNPLTDKGLLYCGKCRKLKQYRIYASILGRVLEPYVLCECEEKNDQEEHNRISEENRQRRIDRNLAQADKLMLKSTFKADRFPDSEESQFFRNYCRHWKELYFPKGLGLYVFGSVGVGKTFYASCVANEIARVYGDTVKALSIAKAINDIFSTTDKSGYIDHLANVDLLVLDDFGAERKTEYSNEVVFSIIDERHKSQKPLILTSNLDYAVIKSQRKKNRIYDRVMDMCVPYQMIGESKRGITI